MENAPSIPPIDLDQPADVIEQAIAGQPVLIIHFSSPSCSVCHATWPQLKHMSDAYHVPALDINIDTHPQLAAQRLVFTVPTILVLAQGKEMIRESRFIGFDRIDRLLNLMADA